MSKVWWKRERFIFHNHLRAAGSVCVRVHKLCIPSNGVASQKYYYARAQNRKRLKIKLPFCTLILVLKFRVVFFFILLFTLINATCTNFVFFSPTEAHSYLCYLIHSVEILFFFHLFRKNISYLQLGAQFAVVRYITRKKRPEVIIEVEERKKTHTKQHFFSQYFPTAYNMFFAFFFQLFYFECAHSKLFHLLFILIYVSAKKKCSCLLG